MITGDTIVKLIKLETLSGRALSYANKTAFQAAGFDLSWRDNAGAALSSQPTWTIAEEVANTGWHRVAYTVPAGISYVRPTVPGWAADVPRWGVEGQTYDEDTIAGLLLTAQGVPGVNSAADGTLGDVVEGDSFATGTLYIPLGKLTKFGYSYADLASGWTISAALKTVNSGTAITVSGAAFGGTVATDGAFTLGWTAFPSGMTLDTTEDQKQWYVDVQLKRTTSSTIITTNRYGLRVVWERDETT
jgi:hypothetical protein